MSATAGELRAAFFRDGFVTLDHDPALTAWIEAVRPLVRRLGAAARAGGRDLRCGGSWFAGVDALGNDEHGAVPAAGVPPLAARALDLARAVAGVAVPALDAAQVSIVWPGYPAGPDEGESEAAFRYRLRRDAAHVDGVQRDGARRRSLGETHAFLLGLPVETTPPGAAPFVVWRGGHEVMRRGLSARLDGVDPADWAGEDVTEAYQAARRVAFETCERVVLRGRPGEAYLVHRMALHGVASWPSAAGSAPHGRPVIYFRPEPPGPRDHARWLTAP